MSVLDPERHRRIIADMDRVCAIAGISRATLETTAKGVAHEKLIQWVRDYRTDQGAGVLLVGHAENDPATQFMAVAGALVRNYIDARVRSLKSVLEEEDDEGEPEVLLIPDFFEKTTTTGSGVNMTQWQIRTLHSLLLNRIVKGRKTILHAESLEEMTKIYGHAMADMLAGHYARIKA